MLLKTALALNKALRFVQSLFARQFLTIVFSGSSGVCVSDRQVLLAGARQDGWGPAAGQAGQEHDGASRGDQIEYQTCSK